MLLFDKIIKKMQKILRTKLFQKSIHQKCDNLNIKGPIFLFNKNVRVGKNVTLWPGVSFQGEGEIVIGDNVFIGSNTIIYSEKGFKVLIGNDSMVAGQCYIINTDHRIDSLNEPMNAQGTKSADILIDDNVWIAGQVVILKGVHIKKGSVIAAKALINKDTIENGIFAGVPAKLIKYRGE